MNVNKLPAITHEHFTEFFRTARERYEIYLRRAAGQPYPWTTDPVFANWRFCNTFRELDKTTIWFKENIREPLRYNSSVVMATLAFRFFNRIGTGEVLKPWLLADDWDLAPMTDALYAHGAAGNSLVTGAYIVKTRDGMPKVNSIMISLRDAKLREPAVLAYLRENPPEERRAESLWSILREFDYVGDFTANEIVVDMYHTAVLEKATDLRTWTNPGPGAAAGLGLLLHDDEDRYRRHVQSDRLEMIELMKVFLEAADDPQYWPAEYPRWEYLHSIQFWFCEQAKYTRGLYGQRLKRRYKVNVHPEHAERA